ncbi:hypothetical protein BKA62DRAFT_258523 [Auriculariales sp. MPI-PUGE-AT-0066]|nr:hypothetical protein BKA62DRAFT_258523 [Auriculariales sp. MPI-PUGE-AT-0066]
MPLLFFSSFSPLLSLSSSSLHSSNQLCQVAFLSSPLHLVSFPSLSSLSLSLTLSLSLSHPLSLSVRLCHYQRSVSSHLRLFSFLSFPLSHRSS